MDDLKEINDALEQHGARVKEIGEEIKDKVDQSTTEGKARIDELNTEVAGIKTEVDGLLADKEAAEKKAVIEDTASKLEALTHQVRTSSKALALGGKWDPDPQYQAGSFIGGIADIRLGLRDGDFDRVTQGKAALEAITAHEASWGKAALGTTDATGGWIIPNAIVEEIIKPAAHDNIYRNLMTVVNGVTSAAVDMPFRSSAPNRAVVATFGSTKENVDLAYNGYTVTMYTLARIHDVSNQFLRQSRGAAEQDVLQELASAFASGEAHYIREGTGSSEPFGYTSALTNGPATFRTTFTAAATLAGSVAAGIATAAGDLAARGVRPTAAVLSASTFWLMLRQGADAAGFYWAPAGGPTQINGVDINPGSSLLSPFGIPVFADSQADQTGTAAVIDNLVVADWSKFKVFFGQNYRVDSSSEAGTRWDANLTGFRGEEEMGFDARPTVYAGHAQLITDIVP